MKLLLGLAVACAIILLVGWLYITIAENWKKRPRKLEEESHKDTLSHRS
jgi:hypothetical protein